MFVIPAEAGIGFGFFMKKFATAISKVFEPAILLPLSFTACSYRIGVPFSTSLFWLLIMVVPTMGYRLWLRKVQNIDWDIRDRSQRTKPLVSLIGFIVCATLGVYFFEPRLLPLFLFFLVYTAGFAILTVWWGKISGHVGGDTLAAGLLIVYYGWVWWPVLLIVPIVAWARVVTKNHTVVQVIAGTLYSWILLTVLQRFLV